MKYTDYIKSERWIEKKKQYRNSWRPQRCLACNNPHFQLHHINYDNLGYEVLDRDIIPLCKECHNKIHQFLNSRNLKTTDTFKYFVRIFPITKKHLIALIKTYPRYKYDLLYSKEYIVAKGFFRIKEQKPKKKKKYRCLNGDKRKKNKFAHQISK